LGVNIIYAVDDRVSGSDGDEYDGALAQKKAFREKFTLSTLDFHYQNRVMSDSTF
jgi:hypothetical protein